MEDISNHLERVRKMWSAWEQHGVDNTTELEVDFNFIAPNEESAHALAKRIADISLDVEIRKHTFLFFWTTWNVDAKSPKQAWSAEALVEITTKLHHIAVESNCTFDGSGALLPAPSQ